MNHNRLKNKIDKLESSIYFLTLLKNITIGCVIVSILSLVFSFNVYSVLLFFFYIMIILFSLISIEDKKSKKEVLSNIIQKQHESYNKH